MLVESKPYGCINVRPKTKKKFNIVCETEKRSQIDQFDIILDFYLKAEGN
jgi:hypothetical protein